MSKFDHSEDTSICSTISSDTHREEKKLAKVAALGWSEACQAKIDEVWSARDDVESAKSSLQEANEALAKAETEWKTAKSGVHKLKRNFMPPRDLQIAKTNFYVAKRNSSLAEQRLKHCENVLDRKRGMGSKLGVNVVPVPDQIHFPSSQSLTSSIDPTDFSSTDFGSSSPELESSTSIEV